ncbi:MAG: Sodium/hydrogen exchanger [Candidatus Woesebacteria bacterium GW2011_GWA1_33_30]|uniref:Sodium/hydrogen exchanger n=1 Tax=Candidatus Woesebacteria bacterium GW2011_GWA2_33_28 TaxID=1618561 RepID=A0A0G0CX86_9BACT|nr:MAG: Sodium/hydrogen exchanger [Candidatus Woesebacteria bacterium GW2011_GWA2_33_28]KKP48835.1 MAG: Sodium/hydrogen exchanger [Candidatus Woesebacteria bacterium GW2011_GWA1_33_30]KKP50108.1 MAG: Sodium/hydrogen exchanger [Microgenomates group bacterium GW2011_GWC1_33_32]KKP51879.1 MAG: Sodium/hydrogen exchanger [Candidatus Woesebacteria bacterium GW2011_GWB1_33_38]KKP56813.1 MAG: Sodium/hydrogen exchanger [Microgenomates group bacterium GW2011_GWD1_33_9]
MENSFTLGLFLVTVFALLGGYVAKKLKAPAIVGYILAGVVAGAIFPIENYGLEKLAELGSILLLFSIGLEFSINKFKGLLKRIFAASILQMVIVTIVLYFLLKLFGVDNISSLVLSIGFSMSSTAVIIKMLFDRGESDSVHGKLMVGWLLIQDLSVIPVMILLPLLIGGEEAILLPGILAFAKSVLLIFVAVILGKNVVPFIIHKIAVLNSRELLLLTSVSLAVGTAMLATFFGISPALGAFIAGFVISESQENHAVFAETRPLKNLFVALFFVTLGFFVTPQVVFENLGMIIAISILIILVKFVVILFINYIFKFNGKTMILTALGLSQVGEFAFIIFGSSALLNLISKETSSMGVAVGLVTLLLSPLIYANAFKLWRFLKNRFKVFSSLERNSNTENDLKDHIIILGFGRVGGWVGKALSDNGIGFIVVDYDQETVASCLQKGIKAIYGDPVEKEVLEMANVASAKAVIIAIPDRISQESIITHVQNLAPNAKIISRVHLDEDWEKLKLLRVDKLVQPEFEAATSIIKNILSSMGKSKEEVNKNIKSVRLSHAKI